jgi:hypothetical protein
MVHAISWFEIPADNFERAVEFYSTVLDWDIDTIEDVGTPNGVFRVEEGEVRGATTGDRAYVPNPKQSTPYLTVTGSMDDALAKVEAAGGTVLEANISFGDGAGVFSIIEDSEGNQVGLTTRA